MSTRRAVSSDLEQLAELLDLYRVFYGFTADRAGAQAFIAERLERGDATIGVAEQGRQLLGFVQLYPYQNSLRLAPGFILHDLYVREANRGQGVGAALLIWADQECHRVGACRMELSTAHSNAAAQKLYGKMGWVLEEEFRYYYRTFG